MGDGRAEGSSAIGDGGQAEISLMPDLDGTGSGSLLVSILSTLLKKLSSDAWVPPGLEIKILYYCTKVHKSTALCRECTQVTMYARRMN